MSVKPIPEGYTSLTPFLCIDGASAAIDFYVSVARAEKAGATIREPAQTFFTGDRFAPVLDPFGQRWTVMTRVEDVSPEEHDRRMPSGPRRTSRSCLNVSFPTGWPTAVPGCPDRGSPEIISPVLASSGTVAGLFSLLGAMRFACGLPCSSQAE